MTPPRLAWLRRRIVGPIPVWAAVAVAAVATTAAAVAWAPHRSSPAGPAPVGPPASCRGNDPAVADPGGVHGLFVLDPPSNFSGAVNAPIANALLNNTDVCGADLFVHWSDVDRGPGASPRYNWNGVENEIRPWEAAGKEVNLLFWAVGYGPNTTYIPPTVLGAVTTVQCGSSPVTPAYWQAPYVQNYTAFLAAAVAQFAGDPNVGYLRFGFGVGGETFPLFDVGAPGCESALNATGFSVPVWDSYLHSMIDFERSLRSSHPIVVDLDGGIGGPTDHTFSDIAAWASADGIGFGSEAITGAMVQFAPNGSATCTNKGFCALFQQYAGQVPLYAQPRAPTDPNGGGTMGPLPPLLRYLLDERAQILEIYSPDWSIAFDPSNPSYGAYHTDYAAAFNAAAAVVG